MTDKIFWMHRNYALTQNIKGYSTFGTGHLIWLFSIIVFSYVTGRLYRSLSERGRNNMRKSAAVLIILLEYAKTIAMGLFHVDIIEFLPLHICSVAGLAVVIYALWPNIAWQKQLFAYAFFPPAILAVVIPSTTMLPFFNFYCIHTFVFHGLIIAFFVWLMMADEVVPTYRGLWASSVFLALMCIPIYFINMRFGVNYMFIGARSDVGILAAVYDLVSPRFGSFGMLLVMTPVIISIFHIFYGIYRLIDLLKRRFGRNWKKG